MNERKKQRLFRFAVDLFIELLKQVTKRQNVPYRCNDADVVAWNTFVDTFGEVGEEFVRKFVEYGIQSWFNSGAERDYSRSVRFSWIVGGAAIKRWNALNAETRTWCVRKSLKAEHKINTLNHRSELSELLNKVRPHEEEFKREYYNTNRGLLWCIANTSLYFHRSALCATCKFKTECKDTLKREYPRVYKIRGYGK